MPIFFYRAKKGPQEIVTGEIEATSQDKAIDIINSRGLSPVSIEAKGKEAATEKKREGVAREGAQTPRLIRVKARDLDTFTRQLASLLKAHVPILRALTLISQQTENTSLKAVITTLAGGVKEGKMLSDSMRAYPLLFNTLYRSMVRSGEKGGALSQALEHLAHYREREQEVRQKIQAALAYPALIIVVGCGTVFAMLTLFFPKLIGLFQRSGDTLPLPTTILIAISQFLSGNWYWILIGAVFFVALIGRTKPGSKKKMFFDAVKLHIPFMRKFVTHAEIAKFSRTLGILIKNGLSVHESLGLATDTLENDVLKNDLYTVSREIVSQGATLSGSLKKITLFPQFAVNMVAVGEEGERLDDSLAQIAVVYEREVEQAIKIMTSLLEPILILVVGGIVGFIVFAMLLPIFNIGGMAA